MSINIIDRITIGDKNRCLSLSFIVNGIAKSTIEADRKKSVS